MSNSDSGQNLATLQQDHFSRWKNREQIAEQMISAIGNLYREKNVIVSVYGRALINRSVIQILKAHRRVRMIAGDLSVTQTMPILEAIAKRDIGACRLDIGKIAIEIKNSGRSLDEVLDEELGKAKWSESSFNATDVVLYGFGRIGRILARLLIEQAGAGKGLRLRAIVVRRGGEGDLLKRASLLRRDSIHGGFEGTLEVDQENEAIIANGNMIKVIYAGKPSEVDYTQYGINNALLIDNTGVWRDRAGLSQHLEAKGIKRVILTAPGKGDLKNIVYGINDDMITDSDQIISAASCTTNAITPVLKILNDEFGVEHGHVETVHSFTNDQNLIDNYHSADRRGRSAVLNMVITETGATKAVGKAVPALDGKLTGNAVRVPTANVSLAILNLSFAKDVGDAKSLNNFVREVCLHSKLHSQIDFSNSPDAVSTDFVGSRAAGIFDAQATQASGKRATVYVWYDNEFGYSCQVFRIALKAAGIHYLQIPAFED